MATVRITITNRFPAVKAAAHAVAERAIAKAAHDIEAHAKANAPVDTGLLQNSIVSRQEGDGWVVESPVDYSEHVEYGTSRMAAQPFMHPAVEIVRPQLLAALKRLA